MTKGAQRRLDAQQAGAVPVVEHRAPSVMLQVGALWQVPEIHSNEPQQPALVAQVPPAFRQQALMLPLFAQTLPLVQHAGAEPPGMHAWASLMLHPGGDAHMPDWQVSPWLQTLPAQHICPPSPHCGGGGVRQMPL